MLPASLPTDSLPTCTTRQKPWLAVTQILTWSSICRRRQGRAAAQILTFPFLAEKLGSMTEPACSIAHEVGCSVITHKYRGSQQFWRVEYSTQIY